MIGNFVTQLAQMKLFESLHKDGMNVIYCVSQPPNDLNAVFFAFPAPKPLRCSTLQDTDSKMVRKPKDQLQNNPEIGLIPGNMSDDLKGRHFTKVIAVCRKTYLGLKDDGSFKMAAKGIPLQADTSKRINMDSMESMLTGAVVEACNRQVFKRDPTKWTIQTVPLIRKVSCLYTGRVVGKDFRTYPMGYENIPFPDPGTPAYECVQQMKRKIDQKSLIDEYFDDLVDSENVALA